MATPTLLRILIPTLALCALAVPTAQARDVIQIGQMDGAVYAASPPKSKDVLVGNYYGEIRRLSGGQVVSLPNSVIMAFAFSPNYASNHLMYVSYFDRDASELRVREFTLGTAATAGRLLVAVPFPSGGDTHWGSDVLIGPDGLLYVSTGDAGNGSLEGDPYGYSQDWSAPQGKILRVNLSTGAVQTWAAGLRNPFRLTINGQAVMVADVGKDRREELSVTTVTTSRPNFGWPVYEGSLSYKSGTLDGTVVAPSFEQNHPTFCSITGGVVTAKGYVYGDLCSGAIWRAPTAGSSAGEDTGLRVPNVTSFANTARGLVATSFDGGIYRLTGL